MAKLKFDCIGVTIHMTAGNSHIVCTNTGAILADFNEDRVQYRLMEGAVRSDAYNKFWRKQRTAPSIRSKNAR